MTQVAETIRNGVDTEKMFATLDLIKAQPELAKFQFRASNRWIDGAHNRSTIKGFHAAGGEDTTRSEEFEIDAGEPRCPDLDVNGAKNRTQTTTMSTSRDAKRGVFGSNPTVVELRNGDAGMQLEANAGHADRPIGRPVK